MKREFKIFFLVLLILIIPWRINLFAQTPDITEVEYFLDSDPGFGNGNSIPITADTVIDENFSIDLSSISVGFHQLFIRVKDSDEKWSLTDMRDMFKIKQPDAQPPAKDIMASEYFFDADPGFGNGTALAVTAGQNTNENYVIDITGLSNGFHELFFRVQDSDGLWSLTDKRDIFKIRQPDAQPPTKDVLATEYFFDTDPGFGNATALPVTSGLNTEESYVIDITGLTDGFHELFFRVQDSDGLWSMTDKRDIFKIRQPDAQPPTKDVIAAEYFFDTDPGFRNGTALLVSSGLNIDESYIIDITALSDGFHELFFRVQDSDGLWSMTDKRDIFKIRQPDAQPPTKDMVEMEYFFDTDPGFGSGTALSVSSGLNIDESYIIDITALDLGFHTLFFRVQDSDGLWSITNKRDVFKLEVTNPRPPAPHIIAAEYFIDTDPGFGNGIPIIIAASTNIDENFLVDISGLITGNHILFVRVLDESGDWSLTHIEEYCHPPSADFIADNVWIGDSTNFTDMSQNTDINTLYYWDVDGDDVTDYTYNTGFKHKYEATGDYNVRLILLTPEGCSDTIVKEVSVYTCSYPTDLAVSDTTDNSAILHWSPANIETEWDIEYGLSGFTLGTGTIISNVTTNSYELTGLGQFTAYDFYVRSACPGSTYSSWAGPGTFTTLDGGPCTNPSDGGTIADSQVICPGSIPDPFISINPATGQTGTLEYKWQISTDNTSFLDIPSSNSDGLVYEVPINETSWFKRLARVDCMSDWTGAAGSNTIEVIPETINKYRTKTSGEWDDPLVWEYHNGSQWVDATNYPSISTITCDNPVATIQNGDTISLSNNLEFGNVKVDEGGILEVNDGAELGIVANDTLTINGKLIMHAASVVNGEGTFELKPLSTIHVGSAQGITATAPEGNIQVSGERHYEQDANYVYIGTTNQQTGDGFIQNTPGNLTINAPGVTVTLLQEINISGSFHIVQGTLDVNTFNISLGGNWTNDDVFLPGTATVYFNNTVDVTVSVSNFYNIVFAGSDTVTAIGNLTILGNVTINNYFNGGSFTHSVYGNWVNNGVFIYGTSSIHFMGGGNIFISVSNFYNIVFAGTGAGTVTALGSLSIFGDVTINNHFDAGSFVHYVYGNWLNNGGTFVHGTSTIHFLGSGNITIGSSNFYHVIYGGTGTITATGALTFYGNVTINNYFAAGSFVHYVYGNWTNNGIFVYGTSSIEFTGSGSIIIGVSSFYNIIISGTGTVTAGGSLSILGDITINNYFNAGSYNHSITGNFVNNGTFDYGTSTVEFNGSTNTFISENSFYNVVFAGSGNVAATGSITFYGSVNINNYFDAGAFVHYVYGDWTNNGTFVYGTSTIHFVGVGNAFIGTAEFYNIVFGGTGTVKATGSISFFGNVTINNYFDAGAFIHHVYGGWINNGTFVHSTSTISFIGSGNIFLDVNNFYNIVIGGTGTITATGSLTIYGDITINNYFDAASYTHYVYDSWTNNGTFVYGTSTIHFMGSGNINIGVSNFYHVIFGGSGTIAAIGSLTFHGDVTINNYFDAASFTHFVYGNWINNGTFNYGTSTIQFLGTVNVYISSSDFYHIIFGGTGNIIATGSLSIYGDVVINNYFDAGSYTHYIYGNWYNYGIFVYGTSTIHFSGSGNIFISENEFYHVIFGGTGTVTASGSLTFYGDVSINNYFGGGSYVHYVYGSWTNTGTFVYGTSTIHFLGTGNIYIGVSDFYHIIFGGTGTITATGSLSVYGDFTINNYFDAGSYIHYIYGNWYNNGVFVYGTSTIHFSGAGNIYIATNEFYHVIFGGNGTITATGSLTFYGDVSINNYFDAGSFTHYVYGSWTNTGTFVYGTSTIHFLGNGTNFIGSSDFYHIIFAGTGTITATGSLYIYGDVTINNYFDGGAFEHYIYGNWYNYGTFVHSTSTIRFVGSGNLFIGTNNFYNVIFAGTGTITASGSLTIYGDITINNYFDAGSFTHYVYGDWINNGLFIYGTSTIVFSGTVQQTIDGSNETDFYGFTVNNSYGILLYRSYIVRYMLTLTEGVITTGSYSVTVISNGSITGGSATAYIYGKLICGYDAVGSREFPVGTANEYGPMALNYITLTGTSLVQVEFVEGTIPGTIPGSLSTVAGHYWKISQNGGANFTFTVTLDVPGYTPSGTVWMLRGDGFTVNQYEITSPNYTNIVAFNTFGDFSLGEIHCPEPAGLINRYITYTTAILDWSQGGTEMEWNVEYGPAGFTPGTGIIMTNISLSPIEITGLTPESYYEFYVQSICSEEVQSNWAGPASFSTFPKQLDASIFFEGPYDESADLMITNLSDSGVLPLTHPYQGSPWNYTGTEEVAMIPSGVVDWVLIEWRDASSPANADGSTYIWRKTAFLKNDGSVVDMDGSSLPWIGNPQLSGSLFFVIRHRNHLDVISNYDASLAGEIYSYDFSDQSDKVYGGTGGHKQINISPLRYGMASGDGNADGHVNSTDKITAWSTNAGFTGYHSGDFNMNGQTDNRDKNDFWSDNNGYSGYVIE